MGTIISKINDEIKLHGSYEAYVEFRDMPEKTYQTLLDQGDIPYFPDPEVISKNEEILNSKEMLSHINSMQEVREMVHKARRIKNSLKNCIFDTHLSD